MTQRTVNSDAIKQWIYHQENQGLALLSVKSNVAPGTLEKIIGGRVPSEKYMIRLARAIKLDIDELFPLANTKETA